jgi:TonB family protein
MLMRNLIAKKSLAGLCSAVLAALLVSACASSTPEPVWPDQEARLQDLGITAQVQPKVPPPEKDLVRDRSHNSTVVVQMLVDASGSVLRSRVSQSSANPLLDQAALDAVQGLRLNPYYSQGKAQAVTVSVPFTFPFYDRPR